MSSESSDKIDKSKEWTKERLERLQNFDKLLDDISTASSREKMLWREIYDHAISDRKSAELCFMNLYPQLKRDLDRHLMGGDKLSKYLERMEKSNTQLIKLAELIQKAKEKEEDRVDEDSLYQQMLSDSEKH